MSWGKFINSTTLAQSRTVGNDRLAIVTLSIVRLSFN